jgi:hypothetical protein
MNQVLSVITQDRPWFDKKTNLDHILATIMSPLLVRTVVHSTVELTSQWIKDIMTTLANNQCNIYHTIINNSISSSSSQ